MVVPLSLPRMAYGGHRCCSCFECGTTLLDDYEVPPFFAQDYFDLLPREDGPPYRWLLVGPRRSGSRVHKDPLATSAWNASVYGIKR